MKIAMITSESNPFVKTGGLADVCYALSLELVNNKHEVSLFMPFYSKHLIKCPATYEFVGNIKVYMNWRHETANIVKTRKDGIDFYFIENQHYFERGKVYGYDDDGERFAFFTLACEIAMKYIDFKADIVHVNDWQSALLPCLVKNHNDEFYKDTKFVLSIHNPAFLGYLERGSLYDLYGLSTDLFDYGQVRFNNRVSTLKGGIVYADKIITVSPTHRSELLTPEGSYGLNGVLEFRRDDFIGILNGIDYEEFNPTKDKLIAYNYSANEVSNKELNKKALCEEFGIEYTDKPLFSLVSRLTWQKGLDLVIPACEELLNRGCSVVILGSGEANYEQRFEDLKRRYPRQMGLYIGYSDPLGHKIYAGSDFFLMPSLFEPCGLGQMIAQRYGTLPIVRLTGGLKDSVINYDGNNKSTSNGFGFAAYDMNEMIRTCIYAYDAYMDKNLLKTLVNNALNTDNSWKKSGKEYIKVYIDLIGK